MTRLQTMLNLSSLKSQIEYKVNRKEIKSLIQVIKQEKDQVVQDLRVMAEDLNKYKLAFKKLV